MKSIYSIAFLLSAVLVILGFSSCSDEPELAKSDAPIHVNLGISTRSTSPDPASQGSDDTFKSLAVFVYNAADVVGAPPEKQFLSTSFVPADLNAWSYSFQFEAQGTRIFYVIANYDGSVLKRTDGTVVTLSPTTPRNVLDDLVVENASGFISNQLLMVGKQEITLTTADRDVSISIPLRRLQARIDVYVTRAPNLENTLLTVQSVQLIGQVLNSEVKFTYDPVTASMLASPNLATPTVVAASDDVPVYDPGATLDAASAKAIFYSYQNLVSPITTIQLKVNVLIGSTPHTYTATLASPTSTPPKQSLMQNTVYKVVAILNQEVDIKLNLTPQPWDKSDINYRRPITTSDFTFGAWGTSWGGLNAKTMNTNIGGLEDAAFSFELKAPEGANWVATLTNGLEFEFASTTSGINVTGVTSGVARAGIPYLIVVRASKRWVGLTHDTELYVTVEGVEIPINPVEGSGFHYPGTATRIKITQVASYN
ncbi:hypothetical protein [Bacteroides neonati]|uniref:hypothetical protein n=1 Tax=Bacteroides neonati TaxID=1347393 RepID=UPI0004AD49D9|nr:hypothetical protein [Bacteroides neonati]